MSDRQIAMLAVLMRHIAEVENHYLVPDDWLAYDCPVDWFQFGFFKREWLDEGWLSCRSVSETRQVMMLAHKLAEERGWDDSSRVSENADGEHVYRSTVKVEEEIALARRRAVALEEIYADRERRGLRPKYIPRWEIDEWLEARS